MQLTSLKLTHFKNYASAKLSFEERVNCFVGKNGMGKTNLLDAIYYLCLTKSHFGVPDTAITQHEADFFRLEGAFTPPSGATTTIVAKVIPRKQKVIERNKVPYDKLSEHIGLLPVVFIAPDDTFLATEGSEGRRRFLDSTLSQMDQQYLLQLMQYNKLLKQRNALLKKFGEENRFDPNLLAVYEQQMAPAAAFVYEQRKAFLQKLTPVFQEMHQFISGQQEQVALEYQSQLHNEKPETLWQNSREKDRILQRTTTGPHKDDLTFTINDHPLKRFASQGQLKSYILAIKLAQYELLRQHLDQYPLLLLDDIFDKLDQNRVTHLLTLLIKGHFGQIFITDTHEARIREIVEQFDTRYKIFTVENGQILP